MVSRKDWTDRLYSLSFRVERPLDFEPGQFVSLAAEKDGKLIPRPYSLVNPPGSAEAEIYSIRIDGGFLSTLLHRASPGDKFKISERASGFLVLSEVPPAERLFCVATGTGLGPFLSILEAQWVWKKFKRVCLVHSARRLAELSYRDRLSGLLTMHSEKLKLLRFCSRETSTDTEPGRVTDGLGRGVFDEVLGEKLNPATDQFMLCGNPEMIKEFSAMLRERGFAKNLRRKPGQITTENYWQLPRETAA